MAILSDVKMLEKIYDKELVIDPFVYSHLQPASIDLTLGSNIKVPTKDCKDKINVFDKKNIESNFDSNSFEEYCLEPGDFIIGQIKEVIKIPPDCNGHIQNRNSIIRLGIDVGLSSYINPGYHGQLPVVIKNIGKFRIELTPGMRICQLVIQSVEPKPFHDYSSKSDAKYHGETEITLSKMYEEDEFKDFLRETNGKNLSGITNKELSNFFSKRIHEKSQEFLKNLSIEEKERLGL